MLIFSSYVSYTKEYALPHHLCVKHSNNSNEWKMEAAASSVKCCEQMHGSLPYLGLVTCISIGVLPVSFIFCADKKRQAAGRCMGPSAD
jgi:hypothetical protein